MGTRCDMFTIHRKWKQTEDLLKSVLHSQYGTTVETDGGECEKTPDIPSTSDPEDEVKDAGDTSSESSGHGSMSSTLDSELPNTVFDGCEGGKDDPEQILAEEGEGGL